MDGTATLGGALCVVFIDGFSASAGDSFVILGANTLVGQFSAVGLVALNPDLAWTMRYNLNPTGADTLSLMATSTQPVPEPETRALLLAGLGLVGTLARRRLNRASRAA